jgi:hypothetical protein
LAALNLVNDSESSRILKNVRACAAGAAVGFSGIMEYQSAIPAIFIFVFVTVRWRRLVPVFSFILGATPFAIALLGYNWICFGSPLELSYHHLASKQVQSLHDMGIGGVYIPKPAAIFGTLLSLHRGLFTTSPVYLIAPLGFFMMWRKGLKCLTLLLCGITLYYLWFVFSADAWYAGWSFGPRLLVPVMGLMMIPAAHAASTLRKNTLFLGVLLGLSTTGIVYHQLVHVVFPELPESARNPIQDVVWSAIQQGRFSPNLFSRLSDRPAPWSMWGLVCILLSISVSICLRYKKSLVRSMRFFIGLLVPPALLISSILLVPPSWNEKRTIKFLKWIHSLEKVEYAETRRDR